MWFASIVLVFSAISSSRSLLTACCRCGVASTICSARSRWSEFSSIEPQRSSTSHSTLVIGRALRWGQVESRRRWQTKYS